MTKRLKILTVCGAGIGTSTLLKMQVQDVLKSLNLTFEYRVENSSVSMAKGQAADLVYTFETFGADVTDFKSPIIVINNLMDKNEIREKTMKFFGLED